MKVRDLIAVLQKMDQDREVIMASDAEGNSFSPLVKIDTAAYRASRTWGGEIGLEELTDDDRELGFCEDDVLEDGVPAVVLCPTN
jgi:hypothetical protein